MAPKKKEKAPAAAKDTAKASTTKRKADDQDVDDDASVPEKKAKLHKMLKGLADEQGNLPIAEGRRPLKRGRQQAPTVQTLPQSTIIDDEDEEYEDDAAPEAEPPSGPIGGRPHDPTGAVNDELQPSLSNEDDNAAQEHPRSKGKSKRRDQTPELQADVVGALPLRVSPDREGINEPEKQQSTSSQALAGARMGAFHGPDSGDDPTSLVIGNKGTDRSHRAPHPVGSNAAFRGERTSTDGNERARRNRHELDTPRPPPVQDDDARQVPTASTDARTRDQGKEARNLRTATEDARKHSKHISAWKSIWHRLGGLPVSDVTWSTFRSLQKRSEFCVENKIFPDLPAWPDERDADTQLREVQRAVEQATLAVYEPRWREEGQETRDQFGQAAYDVWEQRFQSLADAVTIGNEPARLPNVSDEFEAEWAGRLDRFRQPSTPERTRRRFEAAYQRALHIRRTRNLWLRPLENMDGPEYRSMAHYCDRQHADLTNALLHDVRQRDWPPAPFDAAMAARYNRMRARVLQGFRPYGAHVRSPLAASFGDNARAIGFDHERSLQEAGRWQQMGPLGSGCFGNVGVWALHDKFGRVVDRLALKDTYFTRMQNVGGGEVDWWHDENFWYGNVEDRVPKEYYAMQMLKQSQDSENIVECKAYGVYDERHMFRLYLEYCPHADLETTIESYLSFAWIERAPDDPRVQIPNRALWCIFQALATALCLMDQGFIPSSGQATAPPPGFQQMLHRDLKPANIFLGLPKDNGTWPKLPVAKVGDFGGVKFMNEEDARTAKFGTQGYFAPESLDRGVTHAIGPCSDIWAVGRIMLSLMNLSQVNDPIIPAWVGFTDLPAIIEGVEVGFDQRLRELVMECLAPVPGARPTASELLGRIQLEVAASTSPGAPRSLSVQEASDDEMLMFVADKYLPFATA